MDTAFFNSELYTYGLLPVLIFLARVCDVSIGTIRLLTLSRGYKLLTVVLGFCELMVWLLAIGQVFQNLNSFACYFAYAGGFAAGNFVGMTIEEKLALGSVMIRIVTRVEAHDLIERLKKEEYRYTCVPARGSTGDVHVIFLIIKRRLINQVVRLIDEYNPQAFYTVEDVRQVHEGAYRMPLHTQMEAAKTLRKGK
ncbi:MAG: DUF2179 domain-containing protein [Candidatus Omnitrophica bacterium]|nr:DUF2179 domain-containing protein [Candidatus Omnitrophota bacterium]